MIDILDRILKYRTERGWSEYMLSEKSDIPQSTISSWYKKDMLPSLISLEKICVAFDMTMAQLLVDEEELLPLTLEQKDLLSEWSRLKPEQKEAILNLIKII